MAFGRLSVLALVDPERRGQRVVTHRRLVERLSRP
jgi:hypothetical protein